MTESKQKAVAAIQPFTLSWIKNAFSLKRNLQQLFHRPESNIAVLDGFRALAILLVVISHLILFLEFFYPQHPNFIASLPFGLRIFFNGGFIGVNIFFVLSGFLIGSMLLSEYKKNNDINIKRFYAHRFLRLMPVYWLGLLTGILLGFPNARFIWTNLIYVNNFIGFDKQFLMWTWSLAVEEQFYFICPVAILFFFSVKIFREKPVFFVLIAFSISLLVNYFVVYYYNITIPPMDHGSAEFKRFNDLFYIRPYTYFITIFCGVMVAYLECCSNQKAIIVNKIMHYHVHNILALVAVYFLCFIFFIANEQVPYSINPGQQFIPLLEPAFGLSMAYLIFYFNNYETFFATSFKKFLSLKLFYVIAQLSYSMYIFHLMVIIIVYKTLLSFFPDIAYWQLLIAGSLISLFLMFIISTTTYLFLERPLMNLRKK